MRYLCINKNDDNDNDDDYDDDYDDDDDDDDDDEIKWILLFFESDLVLNLSLVLFRTS